MDGWIDSDRDKQRYIWENCQYQSHYQANKKVKCIRTEVTAGRFFTIWATKKAHITKDDSEKMKK